MFRSGVALLPMLISLSLMTVVMACSPYSDGCSTPWASLPYRNVFAPACDRHDACYGCGADYKFDSRLSCDWAFLGDMQRICNNRPAGFLHALRTDCNFWAGIYYSAVRMTGESSYRYKGNTRSRCNEEEVRACLQ